MTRLRIGILLFVFTLLTTLAGAQTSYPYVVNSIAGSNPIGDGGPATSALLEFPQTVAFDSNGNMFIGDTDHFRIRRVDKSGNIDTIAIGRAASMKTDSAGNLYASDGVYRIYKLTPSGNLSVFAGAGVGFSGDGGPATAAKFLMPMGIAVDANNNVYVADFGNYRIRKITTDGKVQTIAGSGVLNFGKENVPALSQPLAYPGSVEVDSQGNVFIGELYRIRKLTPAGNISTFAGNGFSPVDGMAINTAVGSLVGMTMDAKDNLYIADTDFNMIRLFSPSGQVTTIAGQVTAGYQGDGSFSSRAVFNKPAGVAVDRSGNVFVADTWNHRIRELTILGRVDTVVGMSHFSGDNGQATAAMIHRGEHAVRDAAGNIYVSDTYNNRIRKIKPDGTISTYGGTGECGFSGDKGPAISATICYPAGLTFDTSGNLYVAEWGNNLVRKIDANGIITVVAGTGDYSDAGDGGPATAAKFKGVWGIAFDAAGTLYVSDQLAHRVRKFTLGGTITTIAGGGTAGFAGDGGPATAAQLNSPQHLAIDTDGTLYIADYGNDVIRKISNGTITSLPTPNTLGSPDGLMLDGSGNLFASWQYGDVVTKTTKALVTSIIAGNQYTDYSGDGGLSTDASFNSPGGLWLEPSGDILVADTWNNAIRRLTVNCPKSMTVLSGDAQTGIAGTALAQPLLAQMTFRGGMPIAGIPVTFTVTSGSASVGTATAMTDALGRAGTTVKMGTTVGPVVITASAAGLSSLDFHLTVASAVPLPTISTGGITGGGGSIPPVLQISSGGFATIYGSNFAPAGTAAQPTSANWPTNLAGVCVIVNGTPAYVTFVSPGQINFQAPNVPPGANVTVQVITNCGTSNALTSAAQTIATLAATPEFLYWVKNADGKNPVIAVNSVTNAYVAKAGLIAGLTFAPAKPGDILTIYGISFGATSPVATPGIPPTNVASTVATPVVKFGGTTLNPANVLYAGVSPNTAGLYQLNIIVPQNLADGDYTIVMTLGSFSTPVGGFVTVKN